MPADSSGVTTDDHDAAGNGGASGPATSRDPDTDDQDAARNGGASGPATSRDPDTGEPSGERSTPPDPSPEAPPGADGIPDPPVLTSPTTGRRSLRGPARSPRETAPDRSPAPDHTPPPAGAAGPSGGPTTAAPHESQPTPEGPRVGAAPDAPGAQGPVPPGPDGPAPGAPSVAPAHVRRAGGRITARRQDRVSRRGLRVDQRLWSISPWSVFKVSALFYFCMALILLVAGTLLYNAGRSVGTIDELEGFVTRMGAYGECTPTAEVPEDAQFRDDDKCGDEEVLVGGFMLDDGVLFRAVVIGGGILVVAGTIGNVLMVVLLNLLNELTGGVRHTVVREPSARPPSDGPPRGPGPPGGGPSRPRPGGRPHPDDRPTGSPPGAEQH